MTCDRSESSVCVARLLHEAEKFGGACSAALSAMAAPKQVCAPTVREPLTIFDLPCEVVFRILDSPLLSVADVANFGATCHELQDLVTGAKDLWRRKLHGLWPDLYDMLLTYYRRSITETEVEHEVDWMAEAQFRFSLGKKMMPAMVNMADDYFDKSQVIVWYPQVADLMAFGDLTPTAPFHVWHLCQTFIFRENPHVMMSVKYHLVDFMGEFVQQFHWALMPELTEMVLRGDIDEFPLERPVAFACQWMDASKFVNYSTGIEEPIDALAAKVMAEFAILHPTDWIFEQGLWDRKEGVWQYVGPRSSRQMQDVWSEKCEEVEGWKFPSAKRNTAVMKFIVQYMTGVEGWRTDLPRDESAYYLADVLRQRRGWAFLVAVVVAAVAHRFGVICRLEVETLGSAMGQARILWTVFSKGTDGVLSEKWDTTQLALGGIFSWQHSDRRPVAPHVLLTVPELVRAWSGTVINHTAGLGSRHAILSGMKSLRALHSLANESILSMLEGLRPVYHEGQLSVHPEIMFRDLFHPRFFTTADPNIPENQAALSTCMKGRTQTDSWELRRRTSDGLRSVYQGEEIPVNWAVGMVIHHKRYNYTGVIYRWDTMCAAPMEWRDAMRVRMLRRRDQQPFYGVLVEDGSERYVAEENIEAAAGTIPPTAHSQIARFFDEYHERYYVPNRKLASYFPDDERFRTARLAEQAQGDH